VLFTMLSVGLYLAFLVSAPWTTMTATLIAYAATFPFSVRAYARLNASRTGTAPEAPAAGPPASSGE
jgi:hypothetical protein